MYKITRILCKTRKSQKDAIAKNHLLNTAAQTKGNVLRNRNKTSVTQPQTKVRQQPLPITGCSRKFPNKKDAICKKLPRKHSAIFFLTFFLRFTVKFLSGARLLPEAGRCFLGPTVLEIGLSVVFFADR